MALSIVVLSVVETTSRSVTEDVDFRSIDKLLYFVLSLLSLKLKEKGISLGKFSDNVSQLLKCMPHSTR